MLTKSLEYALNIIITIFCTNTCNLYNNHQREHVWEYIPTNRQLLYNHTFHPTPSFLLEKRIIWIFLSNSSQSLIHWISPMASLSLQLAMPRVKKTTAIKNNFKFILSYSRWILPFSYEMSNLRMILCHDFWCIYTQKKCNQRKCNGTIDFIWLFRVFNGFFIIIFVQIRPSDEFETNKFQEEKFKNYAIFIWEKSFGQVWTQRSYRASEATDTFWNYFQSYFEWIWIAKYEFGFIWIIWKVLRIHHKYS